MNLDINAPMVEGVSSVTNKKEEHHTVNKDDSYESYVNTTQIDKAKDELSGQAKGKSEEVSKVFCSLEENEEDVHLRSSWRDERIDDNESDDEDTEDEEDWSDEDEEAADEWLRRQELRERGLPEVLASLPSTIRVSLVPETKEDKQRLEEKQRAELGRSQSIDKITLSPLSGSVRRREEYRKKMSLQSQVSSLEKGKRKFGERMTLEEAGRADFDNGQDYVDFLNSKLQNVSIKMTR